jgi:ABC-2 type transport system permease protein
MRRAYPFLLLPPLWAARNRARRREKGDALRAALFGGIGLAVAAALFAIVFWLTWQLLDYEELGDYLVRLGLSWLFLTFLSFVAFSAIVTSLSTFFLSEDLRLLLPAPVPAARLFHSRLARTVAQSSWMVVAFLLPVLLAIGLARCSPAAYYLVAVGTVVPFVVVPAALGSIVTLGLVSVFPARRARDVLMLMGLLFAVALVLLLRFIRPERLLSVQSMPDVTAFFATLQSPVTPFLPSFWAGESLFAGLRGHLDGLHLAALWTSAGAAVVAARAAYGRHYFSAWSKAQEARKARFTRLRLLDRLVRLVPGSPARRALLVKDVKVFLRDTAQWSQLLLLVALALVYVYNFQVLDLDRLPYMSREIKNLYAFVNLLMAAFVTSAVAVRFVFPAVSAEGRAFWLVRKSPVRAADFLWSKFWTGFVPILLLSEGLTITANHVLDVVPFLRLLSPAAMAVMSLALVGLACGMGAEHPRFEAENLTQVAGSYGGVSFMVLAVLYILVTLTVLAWASVLYLWHDFRHVPLSPRSLGLIAALLAGAATLGVATFAAAMRRGVRALESMG